MNRQQPLRVGEAIDDTYIIVEHIHHTDTYDVYRVKEDENSLLKYDLKISNDPATKKQMANEVTIYKKLPINFHTQKLYVQNVVESKSLRDYSYIVTHAKYNYTSMAKVYRETLYVNEYACFMKYGVELFLFLRDNNIIHPRVNKNTVVLDESRNLFILDDLSAAIVDQQRASTTTADAFFTFLMTFFYMEDFHVLSNEAVSKDLLDFKSKNPTFDDYVRIFYPSQLLKCIMMQYVKMPQPTEVVSFSDMTYATLKTTPYDNSRRLTMVAKVSTDEMSMIDTIFPTEEQARKSPSDIPYFVAALGTPTRAGCTYYALAYANIEDGEIKALYHEYPHVMNINDVKFIVKKCLELLETYVKSGLRCLNFTVDSVYVTRNKKFIYTKFETVTSIELSNNNDEDDGDDDDMREYSLIESCTDILSMFYYHYCFYAKRMRMEPAVRDWAAKSFGKFFDSNSDFYYKKYNDMDMENDKHTGYTAYYKAIMEIVNA